MTMSVQAQSGEPPSQQASAVHIVQRSETLFSIAQQYGSTMDSITHANGIPDPRQIYIGQRLIIPNGRKWNTLQDTTPYVIQPGDTLGSIARHYHITWQTLAQINDLLSPNAIYVGQTIQTPANVPANMILDEDGENKNEEAVASPSTNGDALYVVRSEDTLFRIALRHDVSPWALASSSRIANPALIYPGQELFLSHSESSLLPEPFLSVNIQPLPVVQGLPVIISAHTTEPVVLQGNLFGKEVPFAEEKGVYYALVGIHVFTEPGLYDLRLTAVDSEGQSTSITTAILVQAGTFGYERIDVPNNRSNLLDPAVVAAERERLNAMRPTFTLERHWEVPFHRPCVGAISSYFGTHRAYSNGPYTSYHSGVDFRAPAGTPVYAPAGGTVLMVDLLTVRGNIVLIDHGWGVLTGFWHLSATEVEEGEYVSPGDLIGQVGNTGLSTGAHLHWETWVGGTSVNGLQWLEDFRLWPEPAGLAVGG